MWIFPLFEVLAIFGGGFGAYQHYHFAAMWVLAQVVQLPEKFTFAVGNYPIRPAIVGSGNGRLKIGWCFRLVFFAKVLNSATCGFRSHQVHLRTKAVDDGVIFRRIDLKSRNSAIEAHLVVYDYFRHVCLLVLALILFLCKAHLQHLNNPGHPGLVNSLATRFYIKVLIFLFFKKAECIQFLPSNFCPTPS